MKRRMGIVMLGAMMAVIAGGACVWALTSTEIDTLMSKSMPTLCQNVHHVLIEQGNYGPPAFIFPDLAKDGDDTQEGWSGLDETGSKEPIVVHCFSTESDDTGRVDIPLPAGTKVCKFANNNLSCGQ